MKKQATAWVFAMTGLAGMAMGLLSAGAGAQTLRSSTQLHSYEPRDPKLQQVSDYIVAVVNNEPITQQELNARLVRIELQLLRAGMALPPREELQKQLLQKMIDDRAQVQEAKDMGMRVDDASVQQALQNMAAQGHMSNDQLQDRLRKDGVSITQLRNDLRDELLLDKMHEYQVSRVKVSDSDVDAFIAEQKHLVNDPSSERINLAQILIAVPQGASAEKVEELKKKAQDLAERARHEDFATLVRYSDAQRANAGAMGLRPVGEYPDIFVATAAKLKIGQVSDPVRSEAGFHVLKLLDRKKLVMADSVVQTLVSHIIIKPAGGQTEAQVVAKLKALKQDIVSGKISFENAARQYSQDASALNGGSLGWAMPGQFVPEFESVMNTLPEGQVSDPIVSRFGVHLIEVQDRRRVEITEDQQREMARRALQQQKGEEAYKHWAEDVRARAYVEMRPAPDKSAG